MLNVQAVSCAALDAHLLGEVLPERRRNVDVVLWAPADVDSTWLGLLWQWLGRRQDASALVSWPLLPITGRKLCRLGARSQVHEKAWYHYQYHTE